MSSTVVAENNFLIPNATIFVEALLFFVLLGVLAKWILPPIDRAMRGRQESIRASLAEATEARERLNAAEADYQQALTDARREASRIRDEARAEGASVVAEARQRAQEEANGILEDARRRIEADRERAFDSLRAEIGTLATELAGRVVGEPLDGESANGPLVERFLAEAGGARGRDENKARTD